VVGQSSGGGFLRQPERPLVEVEWYGQRLAYERLWSAGGGGRRESAAHRDAVVPGVLPSILGPVTPLAPQRSAPFVSAAQDLGLGCQGVESLLPVRVKPHTTPLVLCQQVVFTKFPQVVPDGRGGHPQPPRDGLLALRLLGGQDLEHPH